jgi:ABC-2 type transport system permease protein
VSRWRLLSPAILLQETLTDLAGTGYWRYRHFRDQVQEFKQTVADFYAPKIHRRQAITAADYEQLPRFSFREERTPVWIGRNAIGLISILVITGVLLGWTWRKLHPAHLAS